MGPSSGGPGHCELVCDLGGGSPACDAASSCVTYDGVFGAPGMPVAAGLCERSCDPIADNNFLGSSGNDRAGSACGSGGSAWGTGFVYDAGCYASPDGRFGVTHWTCRPQLNPSRFHRTACDAVQHPGDTSSCAAASAANGCASGYEPMFVDSEGSSQLDCIALCAPAPCYNAGSGSASSPACGSGLANITGNRATGHACDAANLQAASFTQASSTANGEQCFYSWLFEFDAANHFVPSPTSDTVGFCVDHTRYTYDPSGGSNATTEWPRCDLIGLGPSGYGVGSGHRDAASFGCVDTATARAAGDLTFTGKSSFHPAGDLRRPYGPSAVGIDRDMPRF